MASLSEDAYVGTLHYKLLDPPVSAGSGVQNPMDANLDGGGFSITNTNAITTGTLNYTTLNPPLPTSGVDNPMVVNLDGGNFNIENVNDIGVVTIETTGKVEVGTDIEITGSLEAGSGEITNNFEVKGNFTVDTPGTTQINGPAILNGATTDVVNFRDVSYKASATNGTKAVPINLSGVWSGFFNMLGDNRSVLAYVSNPVSATDVVFDIYTDIVDVLDKYVVEVNVVHSVSSVPPPSPTYSQVISYGISSNVFAPPTNPDGKQFNVIFTLNIAPQPADVYKIAVRLIKTD